MRSPAASMRPTMASSVCVSVVMTSELYAALRWNDETVLAKMVTI